MVGFEFAWDQTFRILLALVANPAHAETDPDKLIERASEIQDAFHEVKDHAEQTHPD